MKFSDIHDMLRQRYESISTVATARLIKMAFPLSLSRRSTTSDRSTIIVGIRLAPTLQDVLKEVEQLKAENCALKLQCVHPADVHKEMMDMLSSTSLLMTGPTIDNFSSFNVDSIVSDLKSTMPILHAFINEICDTHRNLRNEVVMPV